MSTVSRPAVPGPILPTIPTPSVSPETTRTCVRCGDDDALGYAQLVTPTYAGPCCALCAIRLAADVDSGATITITVGASVLASTA